MSHRAKFKWKGKRKFWINIAQHTHADAILIQPCLSKYHGEIKFEFEFEYILEAPWFLKPIEPLVCFRSFVFE